MQVSSLSRVWPLLLLVLCYELWCKVCKHRKYSRLKDEGGAFIEVTLLWLRTGFIGSFHSEEQGVFVDFAWEKNWQFSSHKLLCFIFDQKTAITFRHSSTRFSARIQRCRVDVLEERQFVLLTHYAHPRVVVRSFLYARFQRLCWCTYAWEVHYGAKNELPWRVLCKVPT